MFQLLKETHVDFMRHSRLLLGLSATLVLAALVVVLTVGINWGIEFTGGTEVQIKYAASPSIPDIRARLERANLPSPSVTTIGDPADNEVYIRMGGVESSAGEDLTGRVINALRAGEATAAGRQDLNVIDARALAEIVAASSGVDPSAAEAVTAAIIDLRRERAIFRTLDDLAGVPGLTPEIRAQLERQAILGPLALRSQSFIGPAIGRELMQKALWAVLGSLAGMLIYIGFRFRFLWGAAAVLALVHDTALTLGLFSLFHKEMSLPVVAAFLTLIGYSVNDTVVTFDRVREILGARPNMDFTTAVNDAINQTLSRTIITSGLTWIVCLTLLFFGGSALNPFSFVLSVGVFVGTYSTLSVASPVLLLFRAIAARRAADKSAAPGGPVERRARKVRSSSPGGV